MSSSPAPENGPKCCSASLGRASDFTARASFAKSLFEAGGRRGGRSPSHQGAEDLGKTFAKFGAKLACLCSSDKVYASEAVGAAEP